MTAIVSPFLSYQCRLTGLLYCALLAAVISNLTSWHVCRAQEESRGDETIEYEAGALITPATQQAIDQGLHYLVLQQHEDGSYGTGSFRGNVAITALAGLAFLASGSTPGRGPYGKQIDRALDYILSCTQDSGFICYRPSASHGPMYGHGFATLFLAECYGQSPRPDLPVKLRSAVQLIVESQNQLGGWRYEPHTSDADISVTVCEVMALRAARNAGIAVPKETIDRAVEYLRRCQNADGGFAYRHTGGESAFARSAAALVALYSAGIYEGREIDRALSYLLRFRPQPGRSPVEPDYYYYGHYYAVQAMWIAGGNYWQQWYPAVRDDLLRKQYAGYWRSPISNEYATALACIILQIPNNCLPIFQR